EDGNGGNNIPPGGDDGIPNVTVALLDGSGNVLETTTTDSTGFYIFDNLLPGDYTVVVDDTDPEIETFIDPTAGTNPNVDFTPGAVDSVDVTINDANPTAEVHYPFRAPSP